MAGISGLAGLAPATGAVVITDPGAPPEVVFGGPASPVHGQSEWASPPPMPWLYWPADTGGQASVPAPLPGTRPGHLPAGQDDTLYASPTETGSHGAPWPALGTADGAVSDREQAAFRALANAELHSLDTGQAAAFAGQAPTWASRMPWGLPVDYVSPGQTILQPVGPQLQGQMGADRVQGTPALNEHGYDSAHVTRFGPDPTGDVPGSYLWLDGSQRPLIIRPAGVPSYPTGPGSPFAGQEPGAGSTQGAVLSGLPVPYSQPPEPPSAAGYPGQGQSWSWSAW